MSGDHAAFTFDPHNAFSGLWQQPGRVSLESDFNEFEEILDRLRRATTYDTVGAAVVPAGAPNSFKIDVDGFGELTIGRGRAYVDGILAECFGAGEKSYDPHLGHEYGTGPITFDKQPFWFPGMPTVSGNEAHLLYLDVWQREVSAYEWESLREPALGGADTTSRVQTAWQVKAIPMPEYQAPQCGTEWEAWEDRTEASRGRLTVKLAATPPDIKPCEVPATAGYVGLQNRLYRVEIHEGGELGTATFKWSRDNASLVATVTEIAALGAGSKITVTSTGRDSFLQFKLGHHIELLDDFIEFGMRDNNTSGRIAKITQINDETGEITVDQDFTGVVDMGHHPRIRRWDTTHDDTSTPAVRPTTPDTVFELEDGISVEFGPATTNVRAGDYWVFAARTTTGEVYPKLTDARPRGILHHYMRLGIVTGGEPPVVEDDCRVMWPPTGDDCCGCDFCVTLQSHNSGVLTVQDAIDAAIERGGGTVCIGIGTFHLDEGLVVEDAVSVRINGSGVHTTLLAHAEGPALSITNAIGIEVSDLNVITMGEREEKASAIEIADVGLISLERLNVVESLEQTIEALRSAHGSNRHGPAVRMTGLAVRPLIRTCMLAGGSGISGQPPVIDMPEGDSTFTVSARIADNIVFGTNYGITIRETGNVFVDRLEIDSNTVCGGKAGIAIGGRMLLGAAMIRHNSVLAGETGIAISLDNGSVVDNHVVGLPVNADGDGSVPRAGVIVNTSGIAKITANNIANFVTAVDVDARVQDLAVADNTVTHCMGGVIMSTNASAENVRIAGNVIRTAAGPQWGDFNAAIAVTGTERAEIVNNNIQRRESRERRYDFGIAVLGCTNASVADNFVEDVGADGEAAAAGIYCLPQFATLHVTGNIARQIPSGEFFSRWSALLINNDDSREARFNLIVTDEGTYWPSPQAFIRLLANEEEGQLSIRGNTFSSGGLRTPTMDLMTQYPPAVRRLLINCTLTDNACRYEQGENSAIGIANHEVPIRRLVITSNQVTGPRRDDPDPPINAWVPNSWTALGNITNGTIRINGVPLYNLPPWADLNITG